jgi:glycosyltransferase involved in cell wall biosynthesis
MMLPIRLGVQQRVLPIYRIPVFDGLAQNFEHGMELFAGRQRRGEAIVTSKVLTKASLAEAHNLYIPLGRSYLLWQTNILAWLRRWKPACLIVEANPRNLSALAAANWMHHHGGRIIGWGLGAPMEEGDQGLRRWYWRQLVRKYDGLIAYSKMGKEQFARLGFDPRQIFISPNAVAVRPGSKPIDRPAAWKGDRATVLFVGRLVAQKRVDLLIRACSALPEDLQPTLWIVGDGPLRTTWEQLGRETYPRARFLGEMHGQGLDDLFRQADMFVLPGTGGLAVQQAMSFSLPVIVGEADGTQADLVRNENGWQMRSASVDALVQALLAALGDIRGLRKKGLASHAIVTNEINLEKMVECHTEAVRKVMGLP